MEPTNDRQLSNLLREWQVEDAPPGLATRVLSIRKPSPRFPIARRLLAILPSPRKSLLAAAVGGTAFLIVVTQAIPQTLKLIAPLPAPPYIVDSEYLGYTDDGSPTVQMFSKSYAGQNGAEVLLERTMPEHPLGTAAVRTLDAVLPLVNRLTSRLITPTADLEKVRQFARPQTVGIISCGGPACLVPEHWFFSRADSGPSAPCAAGSVLGYETILGYSTITVRRPMPNPLATPSRPAPARITMWMAPDLGCFALRLLIEQQRPDGTLRLSEKRALSVNLKP